MKGCWGASTSRGEEIGQLRPGGGVSGGHHVELGAVTGREDGGLIHGEVIAQRTEGGGEFSGRDRELLAQFERGCCVVESNKRKRHAEPE